MKTKIIKFIVSTVCCLSHIYRHKSLDKVNLVCSGLLVHQWANSSMLQSVGLIGGHHVLYLLN